MYWTDATLRRAVGADDGSTEALEALRCAPWAHFAFALQPGEEGIVLFDPVCMIGAELVDALLSFDPRVLFGNIFVRGPCISSLSVLAHVGSFDPL